MKSYLTKQECWRNFEHGWGCLGVRPQILVRGTLLVSSGFKGVPINVKESPWKAAISH